MSVVQAPKQASLLQVARAVFWSFLGIRKRRDYESDSVELKPKQVIIAGLILTSIALAFFVGIMLKYWLIK